MKIIGAIFSLFIALWLINALFGKGIKQLKENYSKPDSSFVFKNGKWDTTITIKTLPSWLK